jgi:hypothetical protein
MNEETGFGMVPKYLRGQLTAIEIAVFVALTWRADSYGLCWPSHDRLRQDAGMSINSVKRALDSLREKGLVDWEPRFHPEHGGPTSNMYLITVWRKRPDEIEGVAPTEPPPRPERATNDTQGTTPIAPSEDQDFVPTDMPTSSGPRDRRTSEFDVQGLTAELEDDQEANGFLAGHNWCGSTEELIETALAEVKTKSAIKDEGAWLAKALANHKTPVGKADHLMQLVGDGDD